MERSEQYPSSALREVCEEIADWLADSDSDVRPAVVIEESLPIWDLADGSTLREAARFSGEWHHQVRRDVTLDVHARSRVVDGRVQLIEVAESPLTGALAHALAGRAGATGARMLRSRRHHTSCLWLPEPGSAGTLVVLQSQIFAPGDELGERAFLTALAEGSAAGITVPVTTRYRAVSLPWHQRTRPPRETVRP